MRRLYLYIIGAVLSVECLAASITERIYVQTDKELYLSGEPMFVKVFDVDSAFRMQHLSQICYLELISRDGSLIQAKIPLDEGKGNAALDIPFSAPSGIYELVAYTRWMRNEGENVFFRKPVAVFNSLRVSPQDRLRLTDGDLPDKGSFKGETRDEGEENLKIATDQSVYTCRQRVKISLDGVPEGADLSVSVVRMDTDFPVYTAKDFQQSMKEGSMPTNPEWLPELHGMIVDGMIANSSSGSGAIHPNISIQGKNVLFFAGQPNRDNSCTFYLPPLYGTQRLTTGIEQVAAHKNARLELVSPFVARMIGVDDTLRLSRSNEQALLERSVALQVRNFFAEETSGAPSSAIVSPYTILPQRTYNLDEYKRFPTLAETFLEFIPSVTVVNLEGKQRISVFNQNERAFGMGNTLVLLDGVAVMNHEDILAYSAYLLKWIKIYQDTYVFGDQIYNGIVALETPDGRMQSFSLPANSMQVEFRGLEKTAHHFHGSSPQDKNTPDFRHTLYWNPTVSSQEKELECMTSDMCGTYRIVVEGLSKDGNILYGTCSFEVQ